MTPLEVSGHLPPGGWGQRSRVQALVADRCLSSGCQVYGVPRHPVTAPEGQQDEQRTLLVTSPPLRVGAWSEALRIALRPSEEAPTEQALRP